MECLECSDNLTAYLDGELTQRHRGELESHLKACTVCAQEFHSLEETTRFVQTHTAELDPRPILWQKVHTRISAEPSPSRHTSIFQLHVPIRARFAAAALAAAVVLSLGVWRYVQYYESEQALQQYMSQYIETREFVEQKHRVAPAQTHTIHPKHQEFSDNPFVVASDDDAYSNPFRAD